MGMKLSCYSNHGWYDQAQWVVVRDLTIIEKNKFQTKQNKALRNRTPPAIHTNVPRFPGMRLMLASDIRDWINRA